MEYLSEKNKHYYAIENPHLVRDHKLDLMGLLEDLVYVLYVVIPIPNFRKLTRRNIG